MPVSSLSLGKCVIKCKSMANNRMQRIFLVAAMLAGSNAVHAHSASDAYLDLVIDSTQASKTFVAHVQWDIALRDLDFVLKLDENGDGRVTWGEVRSRQSEIARYAYSFVRFASGDAKECIINPTRQMIDNHADGAYAALFFDVTCARSPKPFTLDYGLFFAIDPSHRGILVVHSAADVATAVLSPQNSRVSFGP
jgi:hypothetical protein